MYTYIHLQCLHFHVIHDDLFRLTTQRKHSCCLCHTESEYICVTFNTKRLVFRHDKYINAKVYEFSNT